MICFATFFLGAQNLSFSDARSLLNKWEGNEPSEEEPQSAASGDRPLTALDAVKLLWEGLPKRHRLLSVWNLASALWHEALEEGWMGQNISLSDEVNQDQFYELYLASRDPYKRWRGPMTTKGFAWMMQNRVLYTLGYPFVYTSMIGGVNRLGVVVLDEVGPQFQVSGGLKYEFGEASTFFVGTLDSLFWNLRIAEDYTWYRYLNLRVGRFEQSRGFDPAVLLDGFQTSLGFKEFEASLQLGLTGLLGREQTPFVITPSDLTDYHNSQNAWGPPRALSSILVNYQPTNRFQTEVALTLLSDFRDRVTPQRLKKAGDTSYDAIDGGLYQGLMLSLGLAAQPADGLSLEGKLAVQGATTLHYFTDIGQYSDVGVVGFALLLALEYRWMALGLNIHSRLFGGSGDGAHRLSFQEGSFWQSTTPLSFQFRSWGGTVPLHILRYDWGNIVGGSIGAQYQFMAGLRLESQLGLAGRFTDGPVSDPQVYVGADASRFLGVELYTQVVWEPWTELGIILGLGGAYINQDKAYTGTDGPLLGHFNLQLRFDS